MVDILMAECTHNDKRKVEYCFLNEDGFYFRIVTSLFARCT